MDTPASSLIQREQDCVNVSRGWSALVGVASLPNYNADTIRKSRKRN